MRKAHKFQEALTICEKSLHIHRLASEDKFKDLDVANNLHKVSLCFTGLCDYKKALENDVLSLEIKKNFRKTKTQMKL